MDTWFTTPFKILITGISLAIIVTFSILGVHLTMVHDAATVAAYDVANSPANSNTVATAGADSVIHSGATTASGVQNAGMGYATVAYTPPTSMQNLFNFLGVSNPNQTINMSAEDPSNPSLATVDASPNTTGVGGTITLTGSLKIVGSVTASPSVSYSDNGAGGSFSNQNVTIGSSDYSFTATYTTPSSLPGNQMSQLIKITATISGSSSSITTQTFVLVTQAPSSTGVSDISAGSGISIGGTSSNPVINNTGVLSVNGMTGNVTIPVGEHGNQTFTSSGTFEIPTGVNDIFVEEWGGGGAGGSGSEDNTYGGSGGEGAYCQGWMTVTPGQSLSITVGAAGKGDLGQSGAPGGTTQVGSWIAGGGSGGGAASFNGASFYNGYAGSGGTASGAPYELNGASGVVGSGGELTNDLALPEAYNSEPGYGGANTGGVSGTGASGGSGLVVISW